MTSWQSKTYSLYTNRKIIQEGTFLLQFLANFHTKYKQRLKMLLFRPIGTVSVGPVDGGQEAQVFRFDPYPLLQTHQLGCDTLPRYN